jgi:hypothetical protein
MVVQYTTFACGGTALAISITHCLADAQSLSTFAKDWSLTSRALLALQPLPKLSPVFNPKLLDDHAAGMIDSYMPNNDIRVQARRLAMHRYDWYTPVPNQPLPLETPQPIPKTSHRDSIRLANLSRGINGIRRHQSSITSFISPKSKSKPYSTVSHTHLRTNFPNTTPLCPTPGTASTLPANTLPAHKLISIYHSASDNVFRHHCLQIFSGVPSRAPQFHTRFQIPQKPFPQAI